MVQTRRALRDRKRQPVVELPARVAAPIEQPEIHDRAHGFDDFGIEIVGSAPVEYLERLEWGETQLIGCVVICRGCPNYL